MLKDNLLSFVARLRERGIRISIAESIDAMNAVAAAGLQRGRMREALAAALVKDEADRLVFDEEFSRFFGASRGEDREPRDRAGAQVSAASGKGRPNEEPPGARDARATGRRPRPDAATKSAPEPESGEKRGSNEPRFGAAKQESRRAAPSSRDREDRAHGDESKPREPEPGVETARLARLRSIERLPFAKFSDLDYEEARDALAPLARRFRIRLGRRLRIARSGRVDFRRTIRAAIQRGGAFVDLRFRARRPRHVDLVILADISGSVNYAARLMLELAAGARHCFRRVRSFVFIDHLAEAEFEQGHLVMTPALDLYARSDFGRVLAELWNSRAEMLNRQTLVVIMGDGRNNRRPPRADILREIARVTRAVVWLNPEELERWGKGDSAIYTYAREVKLMLPARNLHELERALAQAA